MSLHRDIPDVFLPQPLRRPIRFGDPQQIAALAELDAAIKNGLMDGVNGMPLFMVPLYEGPLACGWIFVRAGNHQEANNRVLVETDFLPELCEDEDASNAV